MAKAVGLDNELNTTAEMLMKLYKLALEKDALLIEVNPYAEDVNGGCTNIFFFILFKIIVPKKKKS